MYLLIYLYNFFWKNKNKNSRCAKKNRHAPVTVHLFFSRTGSGASGNFQCTALLALLQGHQCHGITDCTVDYVTMPGEWCADQTMRLGVYSLGSAPPSSHHYIVNGAVIYMTAPLTMSSLGGLCIDKNTCPGADISVNAPHSHNLTWSTVRLGNRPHRNFFNFIKERCAISVPP